MAPEDDDVAPRRPDLVDDPAPDPPGRPARREPTTWPEAAIAIAIIFAVAAVLVAVVLT